MWGLAGGADMKIEARHITENAGEIISLRLSTCINTIPVRADGRERSRAARVHPTLRAMTCRDASREGRYRELFFETTQAASGPRAVRLRCQNAPIGKAPKVGHRAAWRQLPKAAVSSCFD
jgi:hypothetical protein